jgi:hypothetical protein
VDDFSYAGYFLGAKSLGSVPCSVVNVTATGDIPAAVQAAIDSAGTAGGGVVRIPAGTFVMSSGVAVNYNNVPSKARAAARPSLMCRRATLRRTINLMGTACSRSAGRWGPRRKTTAGLTRAPSSLPPLRSSIGEICRSPPPTLRKSTSGPAPYLQYVFAFWRLTNLWHNRRDRRIDRRKRLSHVGALPA